MPHQPAIQSLRRAWRGVQRIPLFPRCVIVSSALSLIAGVIFGLVRGINYLPTLPVAIIEGAIIVGVPLAVLGVLVSGAITLAAEIRHRTRH